MSPFARYLDGGFLVTLVFGNFIQPAALVACGGDPESLEETAHVAPFSVGAASLRWLFYCKFEFIKMKSNYTASSSIALGTCQVLPGCCILAHTVLCGSSG